MDSRLKSSVCDLVQDAQTVVSTTNDIEDVYHSLISLSVLLPQSSSVNTLLPDDELQDARVLFNKYYYVGFLNFLLDQAGLNWLEKLTQAQQKEAVYVFFLDGVPQDAFIVLSNVTEQTKPSFKQDKCLELLELFLSQHHLAIMFWQLCCVNVSPYASLEKEFWEQLITVISTLPDRMANLLKRKNRSRFFPDKYFQLVAEDIMTTVNHVHHNLLNSQDCSLGFISSLIGKICILGHANILLGSLVPSLSKLTENDFIWRRICEKLFDSVPDLYLESVIVPLIKIIPWYGIITRFLGDLVLRNRKLCFLLTNKLLFMKYFDQAYIIHNIIGYLGSSEARRPLLIKVLQNLLDVWGKKAAIRNTSYDQHLYLSKSILACFGYLSDKDKKEAKETLFSKLMTGVEHHLDSPHYPMRKLGMIVSESLTQSIDQNGPVLKFEYERDAEAEELLSLCIPPEDPSIKQITSDVENLSAGKNLEIAQVNFEVSASLVPSSINDENEELDSDDDLIPYDMSHDVPQSKVKVPLYVRDCMDGLLNSEDADKIEVCLQMAEKLIRSKPDDLEEVCIEFMKILLHLQDNYALSNFISLRFGSMVSLAVLCPTLVSIYLTEQFYDKCYNLTQRMDILDVLVTASKELSEIFKQKVEDAIQGAAPVPIVSIAISENWRDVVAKRIEMNTKRFSKRPKKPFPKPVENRFAPVAGQFFFPLMRNFDRKQNTFDLLGEDVLMLGKLLLALGTIMYSARNIHIAAMMGKSLFDFSAGLRYHCDNYVRKCLIYCIHMVLKSVSSQILATEYMDCLMENCSWLTDIIDNDQDTDCQTLALQTMMVLQNILKKELIGLEVLSSS